MNQFFKWSDRRHSDGSKVTILSGNSISCESTYFGFKYQKCLLGKNEKTKFPKAKGQKSNASNKVPIAKDLELPQDAPDADADVVEVVVAVADAIRGEAPNNQLITSELL